MSDTTIGNSNIGFAGLLTILFIGLKLTDFITWSWWLVFAPLWLSLFLFICIVTMLVIFKDN